MTLSFSDAWIFPRTLPPMVLQYASMKLGYTWSLPVAFAVYAVWWAIFAKMLAGRLGSLVGQHGYLDQNTPRDHVPDIKTTWTSVCFYHSFLFRVYQWQTPHIDIFDSLILFSSDGDCNNDNHPTALWNLYRLQPSRTSTSFLVASDQRIHSCLYP